MNLHDLSVHFLLLIQVKVTLIQLIILLGWYDLEMGIRLNSMW